MARRDGGRLRAGRACAKPGQDPDPAVRLFAERGLDVNFTSIAAEGRRRIAGRIPTNFPAVTRSF